MIVQLDEIGRFQPGSQEADALAGRIGRKALSLALLHAHGFEVPRGFVLTTEASNQPREAVREAIGAAYQVLGGRVAVRSSGTAEDLEGASFAGLYETVLDVEGVEDVLVAVERCLASARSDRVLAYAGRHGLADLRMAVVVQRMVDADVSGVLFTLDPVGGREDRHLIEAVHGLGEALVSGHVTPDRFEVDGPTGELVASEIQDVPTLDSAAVSQLARTGRAIQALYGTPQDIEWVFRQGQLSVVQSRPITAFSTLGVEGEWTTADFRDGGVSARVCSPAMWSLYDGIWEREMPDYLRAIRLFAGSSEVRWAKMFYGRPYWNVAEVKRCLHRVPGFDEQRFDADLGIERDDGEGVVVPFTPRTVIGALPTLWALTREYSAHVRQCEAFRDGLAARLAPYDHVPTAPEAVLIRYRHLVTVDYRETESLYFRTIFNTSNAKSDFASALESANGGRDEPLSNLCLLSGLSEVKHLEPLQELWALAERARSIAWVRRCISTTSASDLPAVLASEEPVFWEAVQDFLGRHGHHGVAELDITRPRWREDPTFVLEALKSGLAHPGPSPSLAVERQQKAHRMEREKVRAHFDRQWFGGFGAHRFGVKLDRVRELMWWREEIRDASTRLYDLVRRETLAVAEIFLERGLLQATEDVWSLRYEEVLAAIDGALPPAELAGRIAGRKEHQAGYRNFLNPGEIGCGFARTKPASPPSEQRVGIACSPGRVTARIRVVQTIEEGANLKPGEILVTRFTDPGWTPLFARIAGVVTETGGVLSHAAVIAREYGIPAVLAVPGATRMRDGQQVVLDGAAGTVVPCV